MISRILGALALLALAAFAADVDGKWQAETPGRGGQTMVQTFTLKADGDKLTGTVSNPMGETEISDGKVNGDEISFAVVRRMGEREMKMNYTGKVSGDEIKFKVETPRGAREFTAKRATS